MMRISTDPRELSATEVLHFPSCRKVSFALKYRELIDDALLAGDSISTMNYAHVFSLLAAQINDSHLIAQSKVMLGVAFKNVNAFAEAKLLFCQARDICTCPGCLAISFDRQARSEVFQKNWKEAAQLFNEAVNACMSTEVDNDCKCEVFASRATFFRYRDVYSNALEDLESSVKLIHEETRPRILESLIINATFLLPAYEDPKCLKRILALLKPLRGCITGKRSCNYKLSHLYQRWAEGLWFWRQGKIAKSIQYLETARNQLLDMGDASGVPVDCNISAIRADLLLVRANSRNRLQKKWIEVEVKDILKDPRLDTTDFPSDNPTPDNLLEWRQGISSPLPLVMPVSKENKAA